MNFSVALSSVLLDGAATGTTIAQLEALTGNIVDNDQAGSLRNITTSSPFGIVFGANDVTGVAAPNNYQFNAPVITSSGGTHTNTAWISSGTVVAGSTNFTDSSVAATTTITGLGTITRSTGSGTAVSFTSGQGLADASTLTASTLVGSLAFIDSSIVNTPRLTLVKGTATDAPEISINSGTAQGTAAGTRGTSVTATTPVVFGGNSAFRYTGITLDEHSNGTAGSVILDGGNDVDLGTTGTTDATDALNYTISGSSVNLDAGRYRNSTITATTQVFVANAITLELDGCTITTPDLSSTTSDTTTLIAGSTSFSGAVALSTINATDSTFSGNMITTTGTFTRGSVAGTSRFNGVATVNGTTFTGANRFTRAFTSVGATYAGNVTTDFFGTPFTPSAIPFEFFQLLPTRTPNFTRDNFTSGQDLIINVPATGNIYVVVDSVMGNGATIRRGTGGANIVLIGTRRLGIGDTAPDFGFTLGTGVSLEPPPLVVTQDTRVEINAVGLIGLTGRYELRSDDTLAATTISSGLLSDLATPLRFTSETLGETIDGNVYTFNANVLPASGNAEWILVITGNTFAETFYSVVITRNTANILVTAVVNMFSPTIPISQTLGLSSDPLNANRTLTAGIVFNADNQIVIEVNNCAKTQTVNSVTFFTPTTGEAQLLCARLRSQNNYIDGLIRQFYLEGNTVPTGGIINTFTAFQFPTPGATRLPTAGTGATARVIFQDTLETGIQTLPNVLLLQADGSEYVDPEEAVALFPTVRNTIGASTEEQVQTRPPERRGATIAEITTTLNARANTTDGLVTSSHMTTDDLIRQRATNIDTAVGNVNSLVGNNTGTIIRNIATVQLLDQGRFDTIDTTLTNQNTTIAASFMTTDGLINSNHTGAGSVTAMFTALTGVVNTGFTDLTGVVNTETMAIDTTLTNQNTTIAASFMTTDGLINSNHGGTGSVTAMFTALTDVVEARATTLDTSFVTLTGVVNTETMAIDTAISDLSTLVTNETDALDTAVSNVNALVVARANTIDLNVANIDDDVADVNALVVARANTIDANILNLDGDVVAVNTLVGMRADTIDMSLTTVENLINTNHTGTGSVTAMFTALTNVVNTETMAIDDAIVAQNTELARQFTAVDDAITAAHGGTTGNIMGQFTTLTGVVNTRAQAIEDLVISEHGGTTQVVLRCCSLP